MHTPFLLTLFLFFSILLFPLAGIAGNERVFSDIPAVGTERPLIRITGKVTDRQGNPVAGAHVTEKEAVRGTITDGEGGFAFEANPEGYLVISFVGYETVTLPVGGKTVFRITLEEKSVLLDNVVVTALGVSKKQWALPYAASEVKNAELVRVKDPNMIVGLTGKVSGLQVDKSASGMGGSARVVMRGMRSVIGNNQPLYVIDGVPVLNSMNEQAYSAIGGVADAGNRDGGDGVSGLNPEDIESITVLKGSPAAALYGSNAANGVIVINTKRGSIAEHKISFSTALTFEKAASLPEFQNTYGVSDGIESWGAATAMPAYDNAGDFFRTGLTSITALSVTSGNQGLQNYFSYANTRGKGIVGDHSLLRHNFSLRETTSLFHNRLKLDGGVNVVRQTVENAPVPGGFYMNPLVGLYRFPRGADLSEYKTNFEVYDADRNLPVQHWHSDIQDFEQNPYWVVNRIRSKDRRTRLMLSLSADCKITEWLKVQARGSLDYTANKVRQRFYASTAPALAGLNGRYIESDYEESLVYGDVMALVNQKWSDFSLQATAGASINDRMLNSTRYDSKTASLKYPNVFTVSNIVMNGSAYVDQQIEARRQKQSVFANAQVGYKETVFAEFTARNDWSSTLAYTSHEKSGFFYPSAGVSWIVSRTFPFPAWVSLGKVRGIWSLVGNDIPLFITNPSSHIGAGNEIQLQDAAPFEDMKPEMTASWEFGTEWSFWNNRLDVNLTYYKTNTRNQFFKLPAQSGDIYAYRYVNAGDIQNTGWEASVEATPVKTHRFTWKSALNYARNRNKVKKLHPELPVFIYGPRGFSSSYAMKLTEGGSFGDIYGKAFRRDEAGNILYETEGARAGLP